MSATGAILLCVIGMAASVPYPGSNEVERNVGELVATYNTFAAT